MMMNDDVYNIVCLSYLRTGSNVKITHIFLLVPLRRHYIYYLSIELLSSQFLTMRICSSSRFVTLLGLTFRTQCAQAFISPSTSNFVGSSRSVKMASSSALGMVRNRGLEKREEGATPLREFLYVLIFAN